MPTRRSLRASICLRRPAGGPAAGADPRRQAIQRVALEVLLVVAGEPGDDRSGPGLGGVATSTSTRPGARPSRTSSESIPSSRATISGPADRETVVALVSPVAVDAARRRGACGRRHPSRGCARNWTGSCRPGRADRATKSSKRWRSRRPVAEPVSSRAVRRLISSTAHSRCVGRGDERLDVGRGLDHHAALGVGRGSCRTSNRPSRPQQNTASARAPWNGGSREPR